jgi:hypothetical protein
MEYISAKPCGKCYGNSFNNDLIILFDEKCQSCKNIDNYECKYKHDDKTLDYIMTNLHNRLISVKELNFNYKIIFAFYVNPSKYLSYEDFYREFILRFSYLLISGDYMILYGLKKHKIKVLKCSDNIGLGVKDDPIYSKENNYIIEEIKL